MQKPNTFIVIVRLLMAFAFAFISLANLTHLHFFSAVCYFAGCLILLPGEIANNIAERLDIKLSSTSKVFAFIGLWIAGGLTGSTFEGSDTKASLPISTQAKQFAPDAIKIVPDPVITEAQVAKETLKVISLPKSQEITSSLSEVKKTKKRSKNTPKKYEGDYCYYHGHRLSLGSRGGCYYINSSGKKQYVDRDYCHCN